MPRGTPKTHFSGFNFTPDSQAVECHAQVIKQVICHPSLHDYIIYVSLNGSLDVISENVLHTSLVCSARVSETERHRYVAVHPERRDERSRELVGLLHFYLVVPGIGIKEAQELTPRSRVNDLIHSWQRKRNFRTCFI
jgi:hypothetical protein